MGRQCRTHKFIGPKWKSKEQRMVDSSDNEVYEQITDLHIASRPHRLDDLKVVVSTRKNFHENVVARGDH